MSKKFSGKDHENKDEAKQDNTALMKLYSFVPSAPPQSKSEEDWVLENRTWDFEGFLEVETKKEIKTREDLYEILGLWIDEYEAPRIKRPIVEGVYLMLGLNLDLEDEGKDGNYVYKVFITKRIKFFVKFVEFHDNSSHMHWIRTKGVGLDWFKITFKLDICATKRDGIEFDQLYSQCKLKSDTPKLQEIEKYVGLKTTIENGKTLFKLNR